MLAALLFFVAATTTQATQPSVARELEAYYNRDRSQEPVNGDPARLGEWLAKQNQKPAEAASWDASMKQLRSSSAADRSGAAGHLLEVMDQSRKDEQTGKAAWRATPYWGNPGENPARQLRESIVEAMEKAPAAPEFIPLVRWVLRNEIQLPLQEKAVGVLGKIEGKEAEDCRREWVAGPHPNALVVAAALDQLRRRTAPLPADTLKALCHHHRQAIRDSARRLNAALKGPDPGPFDPKAAIQSPAVRKTLDELEALMIDLPPKDADFVEITLRYLDKDQVKDTDTARGWLVRGDADSVTIHTPLGRDRTYRDHEPARIWLHEKTEDGSRSRQINVTTSIRVDKPGVEGYVKKVVAIRAKGNQEFELSSRGGLTGQFEGQVGSLPEIILSAWLDRAGKADLAAAVLLPAMDTLYEDQFLVDLRESGWGRSWATGCWWPSTATVITSRP